MTPHNLSKINALPRRSTPNQRAEQQPDQCHSANSGLSLPPTTGRRPSTLRAACPEPWTELQAVRCRLSWDRSDRRIRAAQHR